MTRRRILFLAAALLFLGHALRYHGYLLDDAYISLRYARNLVAGDGLVFNAGERVEGYTNFLWVLLGASFLAAKLDAMRLLGWLSFAAGLGVLKIAGRLEERTSAARFLPGAAVWILALEGFGYWVWTGMESMLFTLLFALGVLLALTESRDGRRHGSVFAFVLLALTRPDGGVAFGLGLVGASVAARLRHGRWNLRPQVRDAAVFTLTYGVYFAWRFRYYGELLPNTFHAKVTGGLEQWRNGLINLGQWTVSHPLFALALLVPLGLLLSRHRPRLLRRPEVVALWLITVGWIGYVVSVGGDFMPFFRFYLPVLPFCGVLLGASAELLRETLPARLTEGRRPGRAVTVLLAVHVVAGLATQQTYRAFVAHRTTVVGQAVGRHFAGLYPPGERIAVNTAGSLPYESGLPTLDMLGLTDAAIARHPVYVISPLWAGHRRGWGAYVLSRRPRAVVWYNSAGLAEPHYLGDHQLADNPYFRFFYQLRRTTLSPDSDAPPSVLKRFLGTPFGGQPRSVSPELGVRFDVRRVAGLSVTTARAAPIVLHAFELRHDREALWDLRDSAGDVKGFLDRVLAVWRREAAQRGPGDPQARRRVESLAARALEHLRHDERDAARQLLTRASRLGGAADSPLPYQYIANLAVLEKSLFLAVHAQQEALRLDPANELFRKNLEHLLSVPFKEFRDSED